jgi:hypothetical protein
MMTVGKVDSADARMRTHSVSLTKLGVRAGLFMGSTFCRTRGKLFKVNNLKTGACVHKINEFVLAEKK